MLGRCRGQEAACVALSAGITPLREPTHKKKLINLTPAQREIYSAAYWGEIPRGGIPWWEILATFKPEPDVDLLGCVNDSF